MKEHRKQKQIQTWQKVESEKKAHNCNRASRNLTELSKTGELWFCEVFREEGHPMDLPRVMQSHALFAKAKRYLSSCLDMKSLLNLRTFLSDSDWIVLSFWCFAPFYFKKFWPQYQFSLFSELFHAVESHDRCACPIPCRVSSFVPKPSASFAYLSKYDLDNLLQVKSACFAFLRSACG